MAVTSGATASYCCLRVQEMLDNVLGANTPSAINLETYGFLDAITSNENTASFAQIQSESRRGKSLPGTGNRIIEIEYRQKQCNAVADACPSLCDPQVAVVDDKLYANVSVDCVKSTGFRLCKEDFRDFCDEPGDRQAREIADRIDDLRKAVNDDIIAKYTAGMGNYFTKPGDVPVNSLAAPKTLYLFNDQAQPNAMGLFPLVQDFRRSRWSGSPIVVGGTSLLAWQEAQRVFAGNVDGLDANRASSVNAKIDYAVDAVFADGLEHLLVMFPGAVQFLEWFQFPEGSVYEEIHDHYTQTTLDFNGFEVDFQVRYNECDGCWDFTFCKHYDLFKMPDDALNSACGQYSNGCLQYLIDCGTLDCNYIKC